MLIGQRLREVRESKDLSQGDIERRTGLLRCYISRVEHGHTVPSLETLQKLANGLEVPLHALFHDGKSPLEKPALRPQNGDKERPWGVLGEEHSELRQFAKAFARMTNRQRNLLMAMARDMAK
jgi:transcriptional regulator with XRE-family HTH domain